MIDQTGDTEAVCEPLIRFEVTLHPTAEFKHLENAPCGETEPVSIEHSASANTPEFREAAQTKSESLAVLPRRKLVDRFHVLVARTGMVAGEQLPKSLRELLLLMKGMLLGFIPEGSCGHSSPEELVFADYVQQRFQQKRHWNNILLDAFGDLPYDEAHHAVIQVVREWIESRTAPKNNP